MTPLARLVESVAFDITSIRVCYHIDSYRHICSCMHFPSSSIAPTRVILQLTLIIYICYSSYNYDQFVHWEEIVFRENAYTALPNKGMLFLHKYQRSLFSKGISGLMNHELQKNRLRTPFSNTLSLRNINLYDSVSSVVRNNWKMFENDEGPYVSAVMTM